MACIGERLRDAIGEGGIRQFHRDLEALAEARGEDIRGSSYAMIHRYLSGEAKPSLGFLQAAAELLRVRPAWLICGEHPATDRFSDSAGRALAKLAELLSDGFTGTVELDCYRGGVRMVHERRSFKAEELERNGG